MNKRFRTIKQGAFVAVMVVAALVGAWAMQSPQLGVIASRASSGFADLAKVARITEKQAAVSEGSEEVAEVKRKFFEKTRIYFDEEGERTKGALKGWNVAEADKGIKGVVYLVYDEVLGETVVFARFDEFARSRSREVGVWLTDSRDNFLRLGQLEWVLEEGVEVAYGVVAVSGDQVGSFNTVVFSYDAMSAARPEVEMLNLPF